MFSKLQNKQKSNVNKVIFFLFIFTFFMIKELNYLYYNIIQSPDFFKYSVYLEHFFTNTPTNREHGLLYYYIHSINLNLFYANEPNLVLALHKSVIQINYLIYSLGLIGLYKLLKFKNFTLDSIFVSFIFLNVFPASIALRSVLKPEIMAFAFLPWIIYLIENFLKNKSYKYLLLATPLLISLLTSKGNILVITTIYLFFAYIKIFKLLSLKEFLTLSVLTIVVFGFVSLENNKSNQKGILDVQSGATNEENYNFKAPKSIIYKIDFYELFSSPIKHNHADSFIAITLLDTNNDYFDLYWNENSSDFSKNSNGLFIFEQANDIKAPSIDFKNLKITVYQQRLTDVYLKESIGFLLSTLMYALLVICLINYREYRKYLISVFLGMGILLMHSISGYPVNNFDPLVGDTLKPLYYSFVLLLSFGLLCAILYEKKKLKLRHLLIYILTTLYILGFPKNSYEDFSPEFIPKVENSFFCSVEKKLFENKLNIETINCKKENNKDIQQEQFYNSKIQHKTFNLLLLVLNIYVFLYLILEKRIKLLTTKFVFFRKIKQEKI